MRLPVVLSLWFVVAVLAVVTGAFGRIPVPPPLIIVVLATTAFAFSLRSQSVQALHVRYLIAPHLVRFVGVAFLFLVQRGTLPPEFVSIGWGDAIAAVGAVLLLITRQDLTTRHGWWSILLWNVFGMADMVMLIITGIRLGRVDPSQFDRFRELPFGILPAFVVPIVIATHLLIFVRLFGARRDQRP